MLPQHLKQKLITTEAAIPRTVIAPGLRLGRLIIAEQGTKVQGDLYFVFDVYDTDGKHVSRLPRHFKLGEHRDREPSLIDWEIADLKACLTALGVPQETMADFHPSDIIGQECWLGIEVSRGDSGDFNRIAKGAFWHASKGGQIDWQPTSSEDDQPQTHNNRFAYNRGPSRGLRRA